MGFEVWGVGFRVSSRKQHRIEYGNITRSSFEGDSRGTHEVEGLGLKVWGLRFGV